MYLLYRPEKRAQEICSDEKPNVGRKVPDYMYYGYLSVGSRHKIISNCQALREYPTSRHPLSWGGEGKPSGTAALGPITPINTSYKGANPCTARSRCSGSLNLTPVRKQPLVSPSDGSFCLLTEGFPLKASQPPRGKRELTKRARFGRFFSRITRPPLPTLLFHIAVLRFRANFLPDPRQFDPVPLNM